MQDAAFAQRSKLLVWGLALLGIIISLRLVYLQVLRHDHYTLLASEEHLRKYQILPNRGEIFLLDRGQPVPVVLNRNLKTLYADPNYIDNPANVASRLAEVTGESAADYQRL